MAKTATRASREILWLCGAGKGAYSKAVKRLLWMLLKRYVFQTCFREYWDMHRESGYRSGWRDCLWHNFPIQNDYEMALQSLSKTERSEERAYKGIVRDLRKLAR